MPLKAKLLQRFSQPTIYRRVTAVAMLMVIALASYLMLLRYQENNRNIFISAGADSVAQFGFIGREMREANQAVLWGNWQSDDNINKFKLRFETCDREGHTLYRSEYASKLGLGSLCDKVSHSANSKVSPRIHMMDNDKRYFLIPFTLESPNGPVTLVVAQLAERDLENLAAQNRSMFITVVLLLALFFILLMLAARWGLRPLQNLGDQIRSVMRGEQQRIAHVEANELERVSFALNELLEQTESRRETYTNAMNDLAHSLKTRIAAVNALLDDESYPNRRSLLDQQLEQMDQLVKYQLRKAILGRQGLSQEHTNVYDTASQIRQMLNKVHQERQIDCQLDIEPEATIACNLGDLMELLGNTMENAYRFADSRVEITLTQNEQQSILSINDDGQGFDPEHIDRLIKRGERADEQNEGQGIGLAVCDEISRSYGGSISLGSSPLGGAKIEIRLPIVDVN